FDADGRRYVDLVCSWGPLLHGHAHPEVVAAVREAAGAGISFGAPTAAELDLAAEIIARTPVERVRLVNSGTEATMSAIRLARASRGAAGGGGDVRPAGRGGGPAGGRARARRRPRGAGGRPRAGDRLRRPRAGRARPLGAGPDPAAAAAGPAGHRPGQPDRRH